MPLSVSLGNYNKVLVDWGLPLWLRDRESACSGGDADSILGSGWSPGGGNGSLLGKSHGQRSLVGYSLWGHKESNVTEQVTIDWVTYNKYISQVCNRDVSMIGLWWGPSSRLYLIVSSQSRRGLLCSLIGLPWLAQTVRSLFAVQETWVQSLSREDPPEKEMATHSRILAWKIPWTEERGRLQSMVSPRVGYDWATSLLFSHKGISPIQEGSTFTNWLASKGPDS